MSRGFSFRGPFDNLLRPSTEPDLLPLPVAFAATRRRREMRRGSRRTSLLQGRRLPSSLRWWTRPRRRPSRRVRGHGMREASCAMRSSLGVVYEHLLSSGSVLVLYLGCAPLPPVGLFLFVWAMGDGVYPMMMKRSMWDTAVCSCLGPCFVFGHRRTMNHGPSGLSLAGTRANEKISLA